MVSVTGDTTGFVTDDPPNVATGDLDAVSPLTIIDEDWEISTPATFGTASVDPDTGEWTYTVDPTIFDNLDGGEVLIDTFAVQVTATTISVIGTTPFTSAPEIITVTIEGVCFTAGTLIETEHGIAAIESLSVGDRVMTADRGLQPIRWIESSLLPPERLRRNPAMRPVRISAGSLGGGLPRRDLLVSQQHRILIGGPKIEILFGAPEVLVAAKHLCAWPGIVIDMSDEPVTYLHILMDHHEILTAEGAKAESLFLGEETLHTLSSDALQELADIFSDRPTQNQMGFGHAARLILREHEALALA
ncbi:Hint domain-containing protein [Ruegeria arenilitoris]|uniref:Hint domain-containing protein n=1 Tax=Ruegeria arenilitoris TaxID=1173585 RepID=UPI001481CE7E|nr:Hint domain-containing protein [Ruegeria arenilitoris]